jgi:hypothetical protein
VLNKDVKVPLQEAELVGTSSSNTNCLSQERQQQQSYFLCCIAREATTTEVLMLQEAIVLQGSKQCKDNKSTIVRCKDSTIIFLYAVKPNDHGNKLLLQEAMTRILFFYVVVLHDTVDSDEGTQDCATQQPTLFNWLLERPQQLWRCQSAHGKKCLGPPLQRMQLSSFYVVSQGTPLTVERDKRARLRNKNQPFSSMRMNCIDDRKGAKRQQ